MLRDARKEGIIPWEWVEDRLRRPRTVAMWDDPLDFLESVVPQYRRDVWPSQPTYTEVWLEKDALSGIFEDVLELYGVTLNVGRGYDSWSSIREAALRYQPRGKPTTVLCFTDFDPSGEDMVRSLRERLGFFGSCPEIVKVALTAGDVTAYNLPPALTKKKDARAAKHIARHGDVAVELDALPVDVLRQRITEAVEERLDMGALEAVRQQEAAERQGLAKLRLPAGQGKRQGGG